MAKRITSLLFKNGFRVFGNTKVLATQLTILTTLASTSLMTTIITNYNLDESKKAILDKGELFDFSIQKNLNNDSPIKIETIDLNNESELHFSQPQYVNHLNNVIESHTYGGGTKLIYNGVSITTLPSYTLWNNEISNENQKLVYYFALQPDKNASSLFLYGNNNEQNLLSLINVPNELKEGVIQNSTEIFSFENNIKNINNGVPIIDDKKMVKNSNFDLRNILVDANNVPVGYSQFGSIQATGFNIYNSINITHNIVNTYKCNQDDFEQFKNIEGNGSVPKSFNIYLGDQNNYLDDYENLFRNKDYFLPSTTEINKHNLAILASLGDSFNQLAKQTNGVINDTKWIPVIVSLDPNKIRGIDLFCYKLFFDDQKISKKENDFFDELYHQINLPTFGLPEKRLNTDVLKSSNELEENINENNFIKYFKTIFWIPKYSNATREDEENIKENFKIACNNWYEKSKSFFSSVVNDVNSNYGKWKNEINNIYKNLELISTKTTNNIYNEFYKYINNTKFYSLDKNAVLQGLANNKGYFEKYNPENDTVINYWKVRLDPILKYSLGANLNFIYTMWFTLEGILNNFGFIYKDVSDFTTQTDLNGISYTFNRINNSANVNNIVSQNAINWDFFKEQSNFDTNWFMNVANDVYNMGIEYVCSKTISKDYIWFQTQKPYEFFKILVTNIILKGKKEQNDRILNVSTKLAELDETKIKNQTDFDNIWKPAMFDCFDVYLIRSITSNDNIIKINFGYCLGLGGFDTIPIEGNLVDKSGLNVLVSETYLSNNMYSSTNVTGKETYTYYDSYLKATKLPYTVASDKKTDFDPTSPNWIYNYDTNKYEFFKDYSTWLKQLPNKYKINVNGINLLIVGSALSPEFLYPAQNANSLLVNPKQSPILYINNDGYSYVKSQNQILNISNYYAIKYPKHKNECFREYLDGLDTFKKFNNILLTTISNNSNNIAYMYDNPNQPNRLLYIRTNFTSNIQQMLLIATIILTLILLVLSGIFICTLIRSIVKQNIKTFGIAISNGIYKSNLSFSMIPFALIPGVIAGTLGYLFATLLQPIILNSINSFWCLTINYNYFIWWVFILFPLFLVGLLFLIIHLVVIWTLRKNVTSLLNSSVSFRMNSLIEHSKWFTKKFRPTTAFKTTYMLGNITRFLTLVGIITTFISMASLSVGSIGVFSTSLAYTERNKNYVYGFDFISPTAQGGWYYAIPYSQIGTTQQGIVNSVHYNNVNSTWTNGGTYNTNEILKVNVQLIDTDINLKIWLMNHFNNYIFGTKQSIIIPNNYVNLFIKNKNIETLTANIQTFKNSDVLYFTPESVTLTSNSPLTPKSVVIQNPISITMQYVSKPSIYATRTYEKTWKDYYVNDMNFTSTFYPSFNIADQFFGDIQFFKDKMFMQETLDIDFDLGAMKINPWVMAKSLLPTSVIQQSENAQNVTLKRTIDFFAYLDLVNEQKIKDIGINYKNYYKEMGINTNMAYNPINIDGSAFSFDKENNIILNPNKSMIKFGDENNLYIINQDVAIEGLPTFEMKPQSVFMINIINTNVNNEIYKKWLRDVYLVNDKNLQYETNFKLATNVVALTDKYDENSNFIESTYTYILGNMSNNDKMKNIFNGKIVGLNSLDLNKPVDEQSVKLYDYDNGFLNDKLKNKLDDGSYPLVINEVVAKTYDLNVGDNIYVNPTNYYNRYIDKANGKVNTNIYKFSIVGITTSKSEQQMYTNQAFSNEILGYLDSDALATYKDVKDSFGNNYVPFNGMYTNNPNSPNVKNLASIYSVSGLSPINSFITRFDPSLPTSDDSTYTLVLNADKFNSIFKFDFNSLCKDKRYAPNTIIDIFGSSSQNSLNLLSASINNVDVSFASKIIGKTIDDTISNVNIILVMALLPTLMIIICLMATMIVSESRRLIAIMKVLGIGDWENTFNFLFIYFVVLVFGLIIALPITYGILSLLSQLSFSLFNIIINPVAPWWIYLATIGCLGIVFAIMFNVVRLKMSRINLSQAIGFEN